MSEVQQPAPSLPELRRTATVAELACRTIAATFAAAADIDPTNELARMKAVEAEFLCRLAEQHSGLMPIDLAVRQVEAVIEAAQFIMQLVVERSIRPKEAVRRLGLMQDLGQARWTSQHSVAMWDQALEQLRRLADEGR